MCFILLFFRTFQNLLCPDKDTLGGKVDYCTLMEEYRKVIYNVLLKD